MTRKINHSVVFFLFIFIGLCGAATILCSFLPLFSNPGMVRGIRIAGFSLLFLGIGEYLNHPVQKKFSFEHDNELPVHHNSRERSPCGLGNIFDILALILMFLALSAIFFPSD